MVISFPVFPETIWNPYYKQHTTRFESWRKQYNSRAKRATSSSSRHTSDPSIPRVNILVHCATKRCPKLSCLHHFNHTEADTICTFESALVSLRSDFRSDQKQFWDSTANVSVWKLAYCITNICFAYVCFDGEWYSGGWEIQKLPWTEELGEKWNKICCINLFCLFLCDLVFANI